MPTPTTDVMLQRTLQSLSTATVLLDRTLGEIIRDAANARTALAEGNAVMGSSLGVGPIGHQAPFEVAKQVALISGLIDTAMMLGARAQQITEAYKVAH